MNVVPMIVLFAAVVASAASGAQSNLAPSSASPPVVTVIAREYAFDAPDSIEAGPTTFRLKSRGREQHFVQLVRIASPHTMADLQRTLGTPQETPWATSVGGVGTIEPGGSAMTTVDLAPGLYAMMCDMQDAHGTPHMMEGMLRALTVHPSRHRAVTPAADVVLKLSEYAFSLPTTLTAGAHVIDVRNEGTQSHMALLWRLRRGKSAADVVHWMDTPSDTGPAPVTLLGGVPDLAVGRSARLLFSLTPGRYLLICLVDDVHDHKPHYAHGMVREIVVAAAAH